LTKSIKRDKKKLMWKKNSKVVNLSSRTSRKDKVNLSLLLNVNFVLVAIVLHSSSSYFLPFGYLE